MWRCATACGAFFWFAVLGSAQGQSDWQASPRAANQFAQADNSPRLPADASGSTAASEGPYRPGAIPSPNGPIPSVQGPISQMPPGQNLVPHAPTIQARQPGQAPAAPFTLSAEEQQRLDQVLAAWEQTNAQVKTFECRFTRKEYSPQFNSDPRAPRFEDLGVIKYAAPDRGLMRVDGQRQEQWICDGRSIFEYDYRQKRLVEHRLPAEMQGKAIADGPLPFLFGSTAEKLRSRYHLRVTQESAPAEIWLEAVPRYARDAANFRRAELILKNMQPFAVQLYLPNGTDRTVYIFEDLRVNLGDRLDPLRRLGAGLFREDPFRAATPRGWQKIVRDPPPAEPAGSRAQLDAQRMGMR